ncbi:unnamed protein product [Calypogeia fissa]
MATALMSHGTVSSAQHQFSTWVVQNRNAGNGFMPNRVYHLLRSSEVFGQGVPGPSTFSLSLADGSRAGGLTVCCTGPEYQLGALRRSCSSDRCPCSLVDPTLRRTSSSIFSQDRSRNRTKGAVVSCVGASAGAGGLALKPLLDQVLLLGTVFGVYIAGIASLPRLPQLLPDKWLSSASQDTATSQKSGKQKPKPQSPESSGEDGWSLLRSKLSQAISMDTTTEEEDEKVVKTPMLGLQAIARVPRLHLLFTTLQHLRNEVEAIPNDQQNLDSDQWQDLSLSVLSRSVAPICRSWLFHDECVSEGAGNSHQLEVNVLDSMMSILKDSESIPSYVIRSGKAGLYADLIFFLRFGSARVGGCCDHRVFKKYTGNILEDMVVAMAEVVATLFLDCSSVSSLSPHGEMWQTLLLPSIFSSRSLERFRNQVGLYGWLNQNFASVAAMFEDRFDLWTLQRRLSPAAGRELRKASIKKQVKKVIEARADDLVLTLSQLPARRSLELKALTGWRYYYSLFLELSDVVGPLLSILLSKAGDMVSFLLITLIGRSLGLVYQGIRQSVRWPSNRKDDGSARPL